MSGVICQESFIRCHCQVLFVLCHLSGVICNVPFVKCHLSAVSFQVSLVGCHLSDIICHLSAYFSNFRSLSFSVILFHHFILFPLISIYRHLIFLWCQLSGVICQMSIVRCHTSFITYSRQFLPISSIFIFFVLFDPILSSFIPFYSMSSLSIIIYYLSGVICQVVL